MSLATRCTACGTVFRVVQDQLKVSEGWVRCGRCKEVFNALEGLFDLDREAPPEWRPSQQVPLESSSIPGPFPYSAPSPLNPPAPPAWPPPSAPVPLPAWPPASSPAAFSPVASPSMGAWSGTAAPPAAAVTMSSGRASATPTAYPTAADSEPGTRDFADARFNADMVLDDEQAAGPGPGADTAAAAAAPVLDEEAPAFIREARARERWQQPRIRLALLATAGVLGLLLAMQVSLHFRDGLAAGSPGWKRTLEGLCSWTGCQLAPPRSIEDIAVESSALTRVGAGTPAEGDLLRLSVTLRNRARHELALPMIDLSLTDPNGQLVARRALAASDFAHAATTLPAQGEASLQLQFSTGPQRIAGYTVEVFYP